MTFSILTVCTGNVCRSPFAEQLLRSKLTRFSSVTAISAGTMALTGYPMDPMSAELASEAGVQDTQLHSATALTTQMIRNADLVLALARDHRRVVAELLPSASSKTFTLREFARVCVGLQALELIGGELLEGPTARFRAGVRVAASERGMQPPGDPTDDDVVDPFRQARAVHVKAAGQIVTAVDAIENYFSRLAEA